MAHRMVPDPSGTGNRREELLSSYSDGFAQDFHLFPFSPARSWAAADTDSSKSTAV